MRRLTLAAVFMIMMCGCSKDGTSDLGLGTTPPAVSPTTTTVAVTTTVPPTEPPPETQPPTTVPLTTPPEPPSTAAGITSKEDQVRADFLAARRTRQECVYVPGQCHFSEIAVPASPMDIATRREVGAAIVNHVGGKRGFGEVKVKVEAIGFEGQDAFVTACALDSGVLFDLADPANDSDDKIVDDSVASYRVRWQMRQINDTWLIVDNKSLEQLTGDDLCGF